MSLQIAVLLGLIQGLTEFLPISSSGHLVVSQNLLGFDEPPIFFDILIHLGTLTAVIIFFREKLLKLTHFFLKTLKTKKRLTNYCNKVMFAVIPVFILGLILKPFFGFIFSSNTIVGISLLITGMMLISNRLVKNNKEEIKDLNIKKAIFIGIAQGLAILPGISRSGATTTASVWAGLKKEEAFEFSFILLIPTIIGAFIFEAVNMQNLNFNIINGAVGFITSFLSGFFALKIFKKVFLKNKIYYFSFYCFLLGFFVLFLL